MEVELLKRYLLRALRGERIFWFVQTLTTTKDTKVHEGKQLETSP